MKAMLRTRLMRVAIVLATGGAGTAAHFAGQPSDAVVLAMVSIHPRHYWRVKPRVIEELVLEGNVSIHTRHYWRVKPE